MYRPDQLLIPLAAPGLSARKNQEERELCLDATGSGFQGLIRIRKASSELEKLDLALRRPPPPLSHLAIPSLLPSMLSPLPYYLTRSWRVPLLPETDPPTWRRPGRASDDPVASSSTSAIRLLSFVTTLSLFPQAFVLAVQARSRTRPACVELATVVDLVFSGRVELGGARGGGDDARWCGFVGEGVGGQQGMTTARQWWRRSAAAVKDRRSLYLTRVAALPRCPELEAAVIRATSHDDRSVDYASAARVFALACAPPPALHPLMWALARRVDRTRCWAVALKSLMLAHGLLLRSDHLAPRTVRLGRVPFDLADFRDRSSPPAASWAFSAFVRAYFRFLDTHSLFPAQDLDGESNDAEEEEDVRLDRVTKVQHLLDLLVQIRPYGDGMEQGLILEAMDCVVIEIFEVYSQICTGIARFLVGVLGSAPTPPRPGETVTEARKRRGAQGMRVLRKSAEQSPQLSSYFELCRSLGVLNAAEFPTVERVPEDDIRDLEKLMMIHVMEGGGGIEGGKDGKEVGVVLEDNAVVPSKTVVTKEWVVFDDNDGSVRQGHYGNYGNQFVGTPWAAVAETCCCFRLFQGDVAVSNQLA